MATRTASLAVANLAPVVQPGSFQVPSTGVEGGVATFRVTASDTAPGLTYRWRVEGPGGAVATLSGAVVSYQCPDDGTFLVSVARTAAFDVAATTVSISQFDLSVGAVESTPATFAAAGSDAFGAAVTFTWTATTPTGQAIPLTGANPTFTPADNGTYGVTLAAHSTNGVATRSGSFAVANAPPRLTDLQVPDRVVLGNPVALFAAATDPAGTADPLTYVWTVTRPDLTTFSLTGPSVAFTPTDVGFHGVRLVVSDGDGGQVAALRTIAALNPPPVASAGGPYDVSEAGSITLDALTGTTDANQAADTLTYEWDFDGDSVFGEASTAHGDERGSRPTYRAPLDGPADATVQCV